MVSHAQTTSVPLALDGQVTAITIGPVPAPAPTSVTAKTGNREMTVSWKLPATAAEVTGFEIIRQPGAVRFSATSAARSIRQAGLANGRSYTYSVRTLSSDGFSVAVTTPKLIPATVPSPPVISTATVRRGRVTLRWKKARDQGRAIVGYRLVSGTKSRMVGPSTRKAILTPPARGAKVTVGVQARNSLGYGAETRRIIRIRK